MNEVIAVIYYCFWLGGSFLNTNYKPNGQVISKHQLHLEADVFSAFSSIMMDLRDGFLREIENSTNGLDGHI